MPRLDSLIRFFASVRLAVFCLLLLMALVLWGTIYQVEHGLYAAQQKYFYSWVFLLFGAVPFPGAQLVMLVLFVNLTVTMLYRFALGWSQSGLILIHLGLLLLLGGGWFAHQFGEESFLALVEGEGSNLSASYREWELAMWSDPGAVRHVHAVDLASFEPAAVFPVDGLGINVSIEWEAAHAEAFIGGDGTEPLLNASGIRTLEERPRNQDPQNDLPGLRLRLSAPAAAPSPPVLLYGGDLAPTRVTVGDQEVTLSLRRKRHPLPVFVRLLEFEKAFHPGTTTPRKFSSMIEVGIQDIQRNVLVKMNHPFRYQGYTFFQASYADLPDGREQSVFAVTRNYGRLLPYIATTLTVVGFVLHFVMDMVRRSRLRRQEGVA